MISLLTGKKIAITKDILVNSHVTAEDQKNLYPFMNPTKYLSIPHDMNDTRERNENLVKDLKYLILPSMSPLLVSDDQLSQLPQILLFTTEYDILRDEGFIFASRLRTLNKTIYHHHFDNAFHGAHVFLYGPLRFEIAHEMIQHTAKILQNYL
ncbi:unnamed protein product [Adineta ricciae]|uniref:Alpha/beta hydrolase fold-3 domain-containing protein n=1 Tax=Adineta ricciae TaxID=249248 RepID=A0A816FEI8_ADIRI|nr:unnamed protein product [Adineta ricciae]